MLTGGFSLMALSLLVAASLVSAYSFTFTSQPEQCADLSLQISGSGQPPYNVLIIPYGSSPLSNGVEVRTVISQQFPGDGSSVSFQLKYPATSQFVAVVSDSSGFGSGGTSIISTVLSSSDSTCFNASQTIHPDFVYYIDPAKQVVQCNPSRLWWDPSQVQGDINFQGVIPGGESFQIPVDAITNVVNMGTGFQWIPDVRAGTTLLVVSGDDRGMGTGGSACFTVQVGTALNSSCITNTSPSSTVGLPAGGSHPTNISGGTAGGSDGLNNTGAIVGGAVGGIAAIVALGLVAFYIIRRKTTPASQERPVNLLHGDPDDSEPPSDYLPPPYLRPVPYPVTEPMVSSISAQTDLARNSALLSDSLTSPAWRQSVVSHPHSATPELDAGSSTTPPTTVMTTSHISGTSRSLRAVNIIQHEDAGPSNAEEPAESETIELPPAYNNIRMAQN